MKKLVNNPVITFYVVNKKFPHPEALVKMMNINYRQSYGPDAEMYPYSQSQPNGYQYYQHNLVHTGYPNKNLNIQRAWTRKGSAIMATSRGIWRGTKATH